MVKVTSATTEPKAVNLLAKLLLTCVSQFKVIVRLQL